MTYVSYMAEMRNSLDFPIAVYFADCFLCLAPHYTAIVNDLGIRSGVHCHSVQLDAKARNGIVIGNNI